MTAADPVEPDLHPGDSNDAVTHLQSRLQALGYFTGDLDGHFGDDLVAAVAYLAERAGLAGTGSVDAAVWAALAAAEQAVRPAPDPGPADPHWHWDGESWQHSGDPTATAVAVPATEAHVDATGQWVWDGSQWQPVSG